MAHVNIFVIDLKSAFFQNRWKLRNEEKLGEDCRARFHMPNNTSPNRIFYEWMLLKAFIIHTRSLGLHNSFLRGTHKKNALPIPENSSGFEMSTVLGG